MVGFQSERFKMPEISKDYVLSLLSSHAKTATGHLGTGRDYVTSAFAGQAQAVADQVGMWTAGGSSTFKVISGDFRPGRAVIVMDGLRLRNRSNLIETVPFEMIASVQKLQTEKRASTFERVKGATAGSLIGGGVGAVSGAFAFMRTGPLGAAVGGTLGALLSVKHKYQICRVTLHDERKVIAVAANTNWLALLASIPAKEKRGLGWLKPKLR
jgi:hypothetical protein